MFGGPSTSTAGTTGFGTTINPQLLKPGNSNTMLPGAFGGGGGGTTAFGAQKPAFGAFGGSSTFGQPAGGAPSAFGQPSGPTAFGSSTGTGLFGKPAAPTTFGAPSQGQFCPAQMWPKASKHIGTGAGNTNGVVGPVTTGSANPPFQITQEKETVGNNPVTLHYQSISFMPEYKGTSFEVR